MHKIGIGGDITEWISVKFLFLLYNYQHILESIVIVNLDSQCAII